MTGSIPLTLLLAASAAYSVGGLFMKRSAGLALAQPTLIFVALFVVGALLQARGMKDGDLGVAYVFVLGVEAVLTVLLSTVVLGEGLPTSRLLAIGLIVGGIAWLRTT
jgi:quaternary ammonium compound-resistance protein SugE